MKKRHYLKDNVSFFCWSCPADLNRRPLPYQGSALPTELGQHLQYPYSIARTIEFVKHFFDFYKNIFIYI